MDKERFIERCKAGDEYALGLLYTNYAPRMKRLCLRYVGDEATAEDILHDGFIIIMARISQLKDAAKLDSWMAAIMHNLAIRHLGQKGKIVFVPIEDIEESEDFTNDTIEIVSEYKNLLQLVETLPQGYRKVFKLSVFDGMSHKEIAEMLGINPHSSSSQLSRAKEMLRSLVTEYGFVPIVIIALLHAIQLDEPRESQRKAVTGNAVERKWDVAHEEKTMRQAKPKQKHCHINIAEATPLSPKAEGNTTTIQRADSTKEERKPIVPNVSGGHVADNDHYPETKKRKEEKWLASVSYSGGADANSSAFSAIPDIGSDVPSTDGDEKVETKSHHYMPFVVSLSLQKMIGKRLSIGTGLRYTRLKTDITTIGEYETTSETRKVEYIGIPLSLSYNLWRAGNLSLYTSTGFAADIPVSGSKTWQWSLSVGAGLQYQLTPSLSIFAEPSLNYHMNSSHGTPTIWTDRPFETTIPFGLRLSW